MLGRKFFVSVLIIIAVGIFTSTLFGAVYYNASEEIPLPKAERASLEGALPKIDEALAPTQLVIPKIKLEAKVDQVGVTKKGNMATPSNFTEVGWYKYGTAPGEKGSAIISGHVEDGLALPAVFSNLKDLSRGDDIYITTEEDKKLHFVVTDKTVYNFNASTAGIFADDSGSLLKLITCTGDWLPEYKTHNRRLVVTAELQE